MGTFSLIATVLNEGDNIHHLMTSLLAQTVLPDEIVIVDGGSTDNTPAIIKQYSDRLPIRLLSQPGCNISQGRNTAIHAAQGDIIAVTDAGVRIPPTWFADLTAPFRDNAHQQLVAGFFHADPSPDNPFQVAMSATVLPLEAEISAKAFLPSSRSVAFTKSAWKRVGGYPEWLDYSEDLIFDLRLKQAYGVFEFAPKAYVYFKPRTTLRAFFKQYYLYARGDGKADLWRKRHLARYITYLGIVPLLALLCWRVSSLFGIGYLIGGMVYLRRPYQRLAHHWGELAFHQKILTLFYVIIIRIVGDIAKMLGYPAGWRWRQQHTPPDWQTLAPEPDPKQDAAHDPM